MDMDNNEKSALEHSRAQLLSYVKGTLENSFPTLASVLKDLYEFRPKMLKPGQRQKGTYCVQCCLKETKDKDLIFPDKPEDITEELKKMFNKAYANSRTYMGSVPSKKVTLRILQILNQYTEIT